MWQGVTVLQNARLGDKFVIACDKSECAVLVIAMLQNGDISSHYM